MRKAAVMQARPTPRWFQRSTSTCAAWRMYSPKMTEFEPAQPAASQPVSHRFLTVSIRKRRRHTQEHDVAGVEARHQEARAAEDELEIVLLAAVARQRGAELEVDGHASARDEHAGDPDEQREADAAGEGEDGAGRREDAGAYHAVEDEEDGRDEADLAARLAGVILLLMVLVGCYQSVSLLLLLFSFSVPRTVSPSAS